MNEEMVKSIASLIDESLAELEIMKKSDRFSASEIKLGGPGSGIAGKDPQGSLGKEEDEEDEEEDEEDDEDGDMDKAEGKNSEADPNAGKHKMDKAETGMPEGTAKAEGKNSEADPNAGKHKMDKAEDKKDDEDKKKDKEDMKKSFDEQSTLLKSYVDSKFAAFEGQLEKIAKLVAEIADTPVPSKSVSYRGIAPLKKSAEGEGEALTKSAIVDKLFELKKSGTRVDSADIAGAEMANGPELVKIANKYNIK
jgi:hypothetical protein